MKFFSSFHRGYFSANRGGVRLLGPSEDSCSPFHGHGIADIISPSSSWLLDEFRTFPLLQVMPSTLCLAHPVHSHALVSPLHLHVLLLDRLLPLLPLLHVPLCCPRTTPLVLVVGGVVARDPWADEVSKRVVPVRPKTSPLISTRLIFGRLDGYGWLWGPIRSGAPGHCPRQGRFTFCPPGSLGHLFRDTLSWSRNLATTWLEEGARDRTVGCLGATGVTREKRCPPILAT